MPLHFSILGTLSCYSLEAGYLSVFGLSQESSVLSAREHNQRSRVPHSLHMRGLVSKREADDFGRGECGYATKTVLYIAKILIGMRRTRM
jgi:hypothetical protein